MSRRGLPQCSAWTGFDCDGKFPQPARRRIRPPHLPRSEDPPAAEAAGDHAAVSALAVHRNRNHAMNFWRRDLNLQRPPTMHPRCALPPTPARGERRVLAHPHFAIFRLARPRSCCRSANGKPGVPPASMPPLQISLGILPVRCSPVFILASSTAPPQVSQSTPDALPAPTALPPMMQTAPIAQCSQTPDMTVGKSSPGRTSNAIPPSANIAFTSPGWSTPRRAAVGSAPLPSD